MCIRRLRWSIRKFRGCDQLRLGPDAFDFATVSLRFHIPAAACGKGTELQRSFAASDEARGRILEFVQEEANVVARIASRKRLHNAEQRLTRWLLMAQGPHFTHEYLAEMISAQHSTATMIADQLQERG
jgi:hypothetical protein